MKKNCFKFILLSSLFSFLYGEDVRALYHSLDPSCLSQTLAFYELYPQSEEAQKASERVKKLLASEELSMEMLFTLINRSKGFSFENISDREVEWIEELASSLPNRKLKGYQASSEKEILELPSEEIDLGKALLFSQLEGQSESLKQVRNYSALLDLMALQILTRVSLTSSSEEKIRAMNHFIFDEMHFRFPPHSIYSKEIDLYTFLPSVMDNHLGVCLGVTALYLSIAQRINLPLEIVTPPGHIYIRYSNEENVINIETTARGIHIPSEQYLGINNRSLKLRTLKEVIGLTHINQASVYLHFGHYDQAASAYEKAWPYLPGDYLLKELLGFSYIFSGKEEAGKQLLKEIVDEIPYEAVVKEKMVEDFIGGKINEEGIKAVFMQVDETKSSILEKQKTLKEIVETYPEFRSGLQQLATTWLQLNRLKEALPLLLAYHELDPKDPTIEYYLAVVYGERQDYPNCWKHLKNAESITAQRDFMPNALKELRKELMLRCPESLDSKPLGLESFEK